MILNKVDAVQSRIKLQRRNPRFKRYPIQLRYPELGTLLLKESSLLSKLLTHTIYTENAHIFPLNMLVEGLGK